MSRAMSDSDTSPGEQAKSHRPGNGADHEAGTAARVADEAAERAAEVAREVNAQLKALGIDTDVMLKAAKGQADGLQKLVADEVAARPFRALGFAAAAGIVLGFLSSR